MGRVNLEGVSGAAVYGSAVAVHLPVARHSESSPSGVVERETVEVSRLFVGCLGPVEFPFPVERHLHVAIPVEIRHEGGTCRHTVLLQHILVLPVVLLCLGCSGKGQCGSEYDVFHNVLYIII